MLANIHHIFAENPLNNTRVPTRDRTPDPRMGVPDTTSEPLVLDLDFNHIYTGS